MGELGARGGEFGGEAVRIRGGTAQAFADGGVAGGEEEPDEKTGENGGGEGGDENHVKKLGPVWTWCNAGCVP